MLRYPAQQSRHNALNLTPSLVAISLLATTVAAPCMGETGQLRVQLKGMESDDGDLVYAMWSDPENWLADDPVRAGSVPIRNGTSMIVLRDLPFGEYAISVYHDRNANQQLDTGLFRIPKEPIGTSNDAKARFGPPRYEDARFNLDQPELTITIEVKKLF
jgi:uncharacterized protein (DUF2141 family)